jgi:uncharacterized protein
MSTERIRAIDIVVGLQTPEVAALRPPWAAGFFGGKIGAADRDVGGEPVEAYLARMDAAGIERSLLFAPMAGPAWDPESWRLDPQVVAAVVDAHPQRFSASAGVDPTAGMGGVRALERAVIDLGFIGAHAYPHWFGLPPDDRRWYPLYAKCCELDVPIQIQVGNCLRYTHNRRFESVGRPITLDVVANDFPELRIIGIHTGWPWTDELIAMAWKHEHVYIGADAYAPKHWDPSLVRFADSWGVGKVLFGTDYPVIDPERARREVEELGLRPSSLRTFLRDAAAAVYRIR